MKLKMNFKINNIQKKIVFYIVVIMVPMFMISMYIIQNIVSTELTKSEHRQATLINIRTLKNIENFLNTTSNFTMEAAYMIKANPKNHREILPFLRESIEEDSALFGTALALEPDSSNANLYCKYFHREKDSIKEKWLMPPSYDYLNEKWYKETKGHRKSTWCEPYFDKGGGNVYMSTYSYPIVDKTDKFLGVVTADVELDILSRKIQMLINEENNSIILVSKDGFLLSHPDTQFNLKETIFAYADFIGSKSLKKAGDDMIKGKSGIYSVRLPDGNYTLYTMYIDRTSWSIGIFLKNSILFKPLQQLKYYLLTIMFIDIILILIMVLIVSNQLKKSASKEEKAKHDLELASKIQQQFLPKINNLTEDKFSLSGLMIPAKEVGGDFYGYRIEEDKLIFYVGDVSGKGVPASLFMMASQMLMEDAMDEQFDPAFILNKINHKIIKISTTGMFATMIIGLFDFKTRVLTYSVAGHPPFNIKSGDAIYTPIPIFALPVAAFEGVVYKNRSIKIAENSTIIAYSDGVSEAENAKLELYETERIAQVLRMTSQDDDASAVKEQLLRSIRTYTSGHEQNDDLTIVVVKV